MKVIKITNHLVDVFMGDGWENWGRFFRSKTGVISQIGGNPLPKYILAELFKKG